MTQQNVIAKQEHIGRHPRLGPGQMIPKDLVERFGYCDFENDGSFDADNEQIIEREFIFDPDIRSEDWEYDSATDTFIKVA